MAIKKQATSAAASRGKKPAGRPSPELSRLIHELDVHRVELETQNEELRIARTEAEHASQQYQELFDSAPTGYLALNAEAVIVRANDAVCRILAKEKRWLLGTPLAQLVGWLDQTRFGQHLERARVQGRDECEVSFRVGGGKTCLVRLDTSAMPSDASSLLVVLSDMSERQRNHAALAKLNGELAARNRELQAEAEARTLSEARRHELEARLHEAERLQRLGLLAAGVAHDFNNLLVGVIGNAELLLRARDLPDHCREGLAIILRTGIDASELTRQLLLMAGAARMETSSVCLKVVVSECVELLRARVAEGVQLDLQLADDLDPIAADRTHVLRVIMNLITNALEALDGLGTIVVRTRCDWLDAEQLARFQYADTAQPGEFVVLRVADTGPGIDAANLTRIFDPFFTTKFTGRGLGLAIALGIVRCHRGALRVSSSPGQGTAFDIAFPICTRAQVPERASELSEQRWTGSGSVLLIDDDDTVRRVVAKLFEALGFRVTSASGGREGLALFESAKPGFDLVALDWMMPELPGDKVLAALRRLRPDVPVIMISGYSAEDLPSLPEPVVRVQKPMTLTQLREAIRTALGVVEAVA